MEESSDHQQREETNHRPVVRHRNATNQRGAVEPRFLLIEAILEQAPDDVGEEQQIEHFAGGGDSMFPKR